MQPPKPSTPRVIESNPTIGSPQEKLHAIAGNIVLRAAQLRDECAYFDAQLDAVQPEQNEGDDDRSWRRVMYSRNSDELERRLRRRIDLAFAAKAALERLDESQIELLGLKHFAVREKDDPPTSPPPMNRKPPHGAERPATVWKRLCQFLS